MTNEAFEALAAAALEYASGNHEDLLSKKALHEAACAYARIKWSERTGKAGEHPTRGQGQITMPFGRDKDRPLSEIESKSLHGTLSYLQRQIDDPAKAKFVASNQELMDAINAELSGRI